MAQENTQLQEREHTRLREPNQYKVIMHNDDFTTMDFVVLVLTYVFYKSKVEANSLMMTIHKSGHAVVGIYSYDTALSKVDKANRMAKEEGFPLKITIEKN